MASKETRIKIDEIEDLMSVGNHKKAYDLIKSIYSNKSEYYLLKAIDRGELTNEDINKIERYINLLRIDKIYIIVALGLFAIIISYFLLVK